MRGAMDTHPVQITSRRWMIALCLLLLAALVQGGLLWLYTDYGVGAALADAVVAVALFAALAYWAWYVLGFVNTLFTMLSVSVLVVGCTLVGSFFTQWGLEAVTGTVYAPFILSLPFRLCYVLLAWSIVLLWYRVQISEEGREEVENRLAALQETLVEEHRKAASCQEKEEVPKDTNEILDRIAVKDGVKIHLIELADLLCIQSCGDYVTLVTPKGEYIKEQTMKYFETHLPEADFIRIHRSAIVQIKQISRLELFGKESYQLILKNGLKLKVSTNGYRLLKERLNLN